MPERWMGIVVSSDKVIAVDAEVPDTDPLIIQADHTWPLQGGDRAQAYCVIHQQVADYARENGIDLVVVKESALSQGAVRKAHLQAAELRGVVMCAAATVARTKLIAKAQTSRTFGTRKVDEYVKDNTFWQSEVTGANLRIGSREAAMVLLAARKAK